MRFRPASFLALPACLAALSVATMGLAHPLNWTKLTLEERAQEGLVAKLEIDLARYVGGYETYHSLAADPARESVLRAAVHEAMEEIVVVRDGVQIDWELTEFIPPVDEQDFFSALPAPMAFARFRTRVPGAPADLLVTLAPLARMELPVVTRSTGADSIHLLQAGSAPKRLLFSSPRPAGAATQTPVPAPADRLTTVVTFLGQGFRHILPLGVDHILFVLGLFLAGGRLSNLCLQVSVFTLAHTCTLAAATLGWVAVPGRVVEPMIAASIIWVAWENYRDAATSRVRVPLVFAFGLFHGLGFAGALGALDLPAGNLPWALVSFNVGVELGQLTVIAGAFALVGWWRHAPRYRALLVQPASLAMALMAGWWAITRLSA